MDCGASIPSIKNLKRSQETADFSSEFGGGYFHEFYLTSTPLKLRKFWTSKIVCVNIDLCSMLIETHKKVWTNVCLLVICLEFLKLVWLKRPNFTHLREFKFAFRP